MNRKPSVVEMFCGAGIFGAAFRAEGFDIKHAIDVDSMAIETYRRNISDHAFAGDVTTASPPSGTCDVLLAGPPCQGFSSLGKRLKDDPRNQLSLYVAKWAKSLSPDVIVIENVPQFLQSSECDKLHRILRAKQYKLTTSLIDCFEYGVPQRRRRVILIASRIGHSQIHKPRSKVRSVREAWKGLSQTPNGRNLHTQRALSPLAAKRVSYIPVGGDKRDLLARRPDLSPASWRKTPGEVTDVWGRMKWDEPSNTLRTCFLNPSKGRYLHPEQDRVITLREGARLHSIPDEFNFAGTPYQIARQIGNSVPFKAGRAIAKSVRRVF